MKRHRGPGLLSIVLSVPMLAFGFFFLLTGAFQAMPLFTLARLVIGGTLLIGGIMLWRGHSAMYSVGLFGWGLAAIYASVRTALAASIGPDILYLVVGVAMFAFLFRESRRSAHAA